MRLVAYSHKMDQVLVALAAWTNFVPDSSVLPYDRRALQYHGYYRRHFLYVSDHGWDHHKSTRTPDAGSCCMVVFYYI